MRHVAFVAGLLLVALVFIGCPKTPARQYYGLSYSLSDVPAPTEAKYKATLMIREPDILLAYDRAQIVYRYDPFRFKYYNYKYWLAKPQQMIRELVYRHVKHVNLFSEVTLTFQRHAPDYVLEGMIDAIEEYDSGDVWYSHLAMSLRLVRYEDRVVIWTHKFDVQKEVFTKKPVYVVRAMSEQIEAEMGIIVKGIDAAMAKEKLGGADGGDR
jgi:ABC-type uncharacterized transport system auxiliary subunit